MASAGATSGATKKPKIYSEVRQARINKDGGSHVEYEVCALTQALAPDGRKGFKESTVKWALWKRYSEFKDLDAALRAVYGWQMDHIKLPPKKTFGNTSPAFVEQRRIQLQEYIQAVLVIKGITDFDKHFGSKDLQAFFEFDARVAAALGSLAAGGEDTFDAEGGAEAGAGGGAAAPRPVSGRRKPLKGGRRTSMRRGGPAKTGSLGKPAASRASAGAGAGASGGASAGAGASTAARPAPAAAAPPAPPAAAAPAPAPSGPPSGKPPDGLPPPQPGRGGLLAEIRGGKKLKKTTTVDKSLPRT